MQYTKWFVDAGFALSLIINAFLFIPQILVIWRKKSAADVSLITFLGFNIIQLFTAVHGLLNKDYLLAFGTTLSILTCGTVTILIIYFNIYRRE